MRSIFKTFTGTLTLFLFSILAVHAQEVEMADGLRASGKIYVVVSVLVLIFAGIAAYLFLLDRKIRRLEKGKENRES